LNEKFAPIVLAGTNDHDLSILREYAEFWKVPYTLGIQLDGIPLLVTSSLSKAVDMREAGPVIISPTGIEGAKEIARQFGLNVSIDETLVRLPVTEGFSVSLQTKLYQFFYTALNPILPLLKSAFPQYITTTEQLGRAMLRVAKQGFPKPILETKDIDSL